MIENKLLAVDLFSGAGGLSLGFMQTDQVQIVAAVENNPFAQKTYLRNHPDTKIYGDIREVNYEDILKECKAIGNGRISIVFGGPPCQGFSNANRQKSTLISANNQLVKDYVKAIEKLSPDGFIMENVKDLKSIKHKFFYSILDIDEIKKLELKLIREDILIGESNFLTEELVEFLRNSMQNNNISNYIINNKILFSKLCYISRKEKKPDGILEKFREFIKNDTEVWENFHTLYWNDDYKEKWMKLLDYLNDVEANKYELYECLNQIIAIQQIIIKINEIIINHIDTFAVFLKKNEIFITVKTYIVLDYLKAKFKSIGYKFNEDDLILNAANFGAPQLRERLFLIGVKEALVKEENIKLPSILLKSDQFFTVKDAIQDLENLEPHTTIQEDVSREKPELVTNNILLNYLRAGSSSVMNHLMTNTTPTALERFELLQQGQNFHHLEEKYKQTYSNPSRTQNTVYLKLKYDTPSGTVLNVRKSMWVHPTKNRAISIREAARLQTFPDDFIFEGTKDSQYQQVGNAVPPLLGRAVAEQLLFYLGRKPLHSLASIIKIKAFTFK